jgi:hypothetical protein
MSADSGDPLGSGILRWLLKELDRISVRYGQHTPERAQDVRPERNEKPDERSEPAQEQEKDRN